SLSFKRWRTGRPACAARRTTSSVPSLEALSTTMTSNRSRGYVWAARHSSRSLRWPARLRVGTTTDTVAAITACGWSPEGSALVVTERTLTLRACDRAAEQPATQRHDDG